MAGLYGTPGTVHVDDEFLPFVCEFLTGIVEGQFPHLGHIRTNLHLVLQAMNLDILFQQAVLRCGIQGRLMVLAQIGRYERT